MLVSLLFQATAYGSVTYDPSTTTAYGFQLDQNHGYQWDYNNVEFDYNNYNDTYDYSLVTGTMYNFGAILPSLSGFSSAMIRLT